MRQQYSPVVRTLLFFPTLCGILLASLPLDGRTCEASPIKRSCCQTTSPGESAMPGCCGCCPPAKSVATETQPRLSCPCRATDQPPATPERGSGPIMRLRVMATDIVEFASAGQGCDDACVARERYDAIPPPSEQYGGLLVKNCVWQI